MKRVLLHRVTDLVVVLFGISAIVFLMIRLIPGDAVAIMLGANTEVTPERVAVLRARIGLDRPLVEQYLHWAGAALRGDLGTSLWTGRPVAGEILAHLGPTLELTLLSLVLGAGLAVPVGCLMAQTRGRGADVLMRVGAIAGLTIPSFWLGIVLILLLSQWAPGFASLGYVPFGEDPVGNLERMVLPATALGLPILANLSRLVRSAMLDALGQDYIRTARAKGASVGLVVYKHALRNALIPLITYWGVSIAALITGSVLIEVVFALNGMGRLTVDAINQRDWPIVQTVVLFFVLITLTINLVVDLLYGALDPRIKLS